MNEVVFLYNLKLHFKYNNEDTYLGTASAGDTAVLLLHFMLLLTSNETSALVLLLTSKLAGDAKVIQSKYKAYAA